VKRLQELEKENSRLKHLLAEPDLELDVVKEFLQKSSLDPGAQGGGGVFGFAKNIGSAGVLVFGIEPELAEVFECGERRRPGGSIDGTGQDTSAARRANAVGDAASPRVESKCKESCPAVQKALTSFEEKTPEKTARNWDSSTEPRGTAQSGLSVRFCGRSDRVGQEAADLDSHR
jgi:hypothetical protein